jgi:RNA polymerase sigma factor (sigma-70 family)
MLRGTARFQTTSWSLVFAAAGNPTTESRKALASLCQIYWHPIYAFIRRNGYDQDQAKDLTQAFFVVLLEKNYVGDADQHRGRFRSFLLSSVKHFLANEWDRAHALKRGGEVPLHISAETELRYPEEAVEHRTPESLFERRWALSVLEQVMAKLRARLATKGKAGHFDKLAGLLQGDPMEAPYEALAQEMGVSAGALRTMVHRLRREYRDLLRAEIAATVSTPEEIDDEIRFLLSSLSAP